MLGSRRGSKGLCAEAVADVADRFAVRPGSIVRAGGTAGLSDVRRATGGARSVRGGKCTASGRDGNRSRARSEAGRLGSGVRAATASAACVIVPSWAVTGSMGVALAATLAILFTVAAAWIMI